MADAIDCAIPHSFTTMIRELQSDPQWVVWNSTFSRNRFFLTDTLRYDNIHSREYCLAVFALLLMRKLKDLS